MARASSTSGTQHIPARMLAVRRTSVSEVAPVLADDDAITYTRGTRAITGRARRHASACDCYDVIPAATDEAMSTR